MNIRLLSLLVLTLISLTGFSQESKKVTEFKDCGPVFFNTEIPPKYNGGLKSLELKMNESLSFKKGLNYKTFINFKIDCEGNIGKFICQGNGKESINKQLTEALLKVSDWEAGINKGKKVTCSKTIGITLKKGKIRLENYEIK